MRYFNFGLIFLLCVGTVTAQKKLSFAQNQPIGYHSDIASIEAPQKKSVFLAVVASLVLPGAGEWYAGSFESGKYYMIAEGGLWLTYAGFRTYSTWLRHDAEQYALQHAQTDISNKDDKYAVDVGNFMTTDEYNLTRIRNAEYDLMYVDNSNTWSWDSDANRARFKDIRIRSDRIKNNSNFVIAVVVVNHLLSAFSAGKKAANYNRSLSEERSVEIQPYAIALRTGVQDFVIGITAQF